MNPIVLRKLEEIVGHDNVQNSLESRIAYSYDATAMKPHLPEAVVRPSNAEEISRIVTLANEEHFSIVPRGSGTGLSGGALPFAHSFFLFSNHLNIILVID